ncbi:MAG: methionine--tRNA ligase [Chlamydiia bacterium]|nr:methionine--tRNA ligase [Chlamydiia bacterium]
MRPKRYLVTAALPYANGPLHFGHIAGCYLPADCFARFKRLCGEEVFFVSGSDEYGVAITLSAEQAGRTPKEHVDIFHSINKKLFEALQISFDHFSRTTIDIHTKTAQEFFTTLLQNGYIEEQMSEQLYSEADQRFLADRYVEGICPKCGFEKARGDECTSCGASYEATDLKNPRSKLTGSPLTTKSTKHWFLRFDKFKDQLQAWIQDKPWKSNVKSFAKHYIDELKPRAITRDSDWGIPVPLEGAEGKVLYVWFDAPIGYISMTKEWNPLRWKEYWCDASTHLTQFIGKDNIPFHAIFFPAMLMGMEENYQLVDDLPANEFLQFEGKQFSKSSGHTIDLDRFFQQFSADQIRYVLAANAPETQDSDFSWSDFQTRCNAELVGKLGNFANRSLVFVQRKMDAIVPTTATVAPDDEAFLAKIQQLMSDIHIAYEGYHLRRATQLIMELAQMGNVYFDAKQPWKDPDGAKTTLYCCLECLKNLAIASSPIIPATAQKLWQLLGYTAPLTAWAQPSIPSQQKLPSPTILFAKVEEEQLAAAK